MAADDVETLRLLCMGDNHGDVDSLERVVDGTEGEEFDFVIHVGDITNAWFDGVDEGREQLDAVTPYFETLHERGEFLYIWGNRDGAIGPEQPFQDYDLPGTFIPEDDTITVAGETFTQNPELVEDETILVNHYWHPELLEHFAGKPTSLVIYTPAGTRTRLSTPHSSTGRLIMARMLFSARTSSSRLHLTVRGRSISEISGRFGKGSVPSIRHSVYSSSRTTGDRTVSSATTKTISTVRWFAQHSTDWEQYKRKPRLTKL